MDQAEMRLYTIDRLTMAIGCIKSVTISIFSLIFLVSCAGTVERADEYAAQDEWIKAVLEYRKAVSKTPQSVEYRSRLKQTEQKAADYYYQRGIRLFEHDNLDTAIEQYQHGLTAMPENDKLLQAMNAALARKEAANLHGQGLKAAEAGKNEEAIRYFKKALDIYPGYKNASVALKELQAQTIAEEDGDKLMVSSRAPITLNFRQTDMRTAFEFVAKSFGVDIIFDEAIRSTPITLFAKDVTFEQSLNLMLATTKTFYKRIGPNTILISPDTKEKRAQYEDQYVHTYQLSSIKAKEMADIIKGLINTKKLIVNDSLNSIVVRDTEEVIRLIDKIIEANDRRAAEVILEVEILEVNRNKAERLGVDLGSYSVKALIPSSATIPVTGSIAESIRNSAQLTLPTVTFNFYKQDVDAKILANPKVRVLSGKSAKIHIGDRIPLRSATIDTSLTGTRTTYEYKDVGIKLNAEPNIHIDNSVTVKVGLEVSSLGENLGTQQEPAYRIGTRNAETFMTLRDGETAILGGLIRDEDRAAKVGMPFIGEIPAVGTLLSSHDNSSGRTDVLLTITPRVVRGWDFPGKDAQNFVSGTEDKYLNENLFGDLAAPTSKAEKVTSPVSAISGSTQSSSALPASDNQVAEQLPAEKGGVHNDQLESVISFSSPIYEAASGKEFDIILTAENLDKTINMPVEIIFNSQLLNFVKGEAGDFASPSRFSANADESRGIIRLELEYPPNAPAEGGGAFAKLTLRGEKPGTSYLVYRSLTTKGVSDKSQTPQVRASRVVLK